jgi:hypothetical protein
MQYSAVKSLLQETAKSMKKQGVDVVANYPQILADDALFDYYVEALSEGLELNMKDEFKTMSGLVREGILAETVYGFKPQAQLILPVFRKMWPALVAREALTVLPMEQPEIIRPFLIAVAKVGNEEFDLPNLQRDVSSATQIGVTAPALVAVPSITDLLAAQGLNPSQAHLQRDFQIVSVTFTTDNGSTTSDVDILVEPNEEGMFNFDVELGTSGLVDHVSGNVDYFKGTVTVSNTRAGEAERVTGISIVASISGFEEMYANKISFKHLKIRMNAIDHEVQAEWTIQYEQDVKAYFDMDVQAQLVDTFGNVIALDIDRKLINALIRETSIFHPNAIKTFSKTPDANFAFGRKEWYNQIVVQLNEVSNQIYVDTNIGVANTIVANPLDVAILKTTSDYSFKGNTVGGGAFGNSPIAGVLDDTWKVLSSPVVPQGKMIVLLKPENPDHAVFVFAPYRPLTITPFPLGRKPVMTFLSRYAAKFIRHEGVGLIEITN